MERGNVIGTGTGASSHPYEGLGPRKRNSQPWECFRGRGDFFPLVICASSVEVVSGMIGHFGVGEDG